MIVIGIPLFVLSLNIVSHFRHSTFRTDIFCKASKNIVFFVASCLIGSVLGIVAADENSTQTSSKPKKTHDAQHFDSEYDRGKHQLSQGDFEGALLTFRKALRNEFDNRNLTNDFEQLQQMITLREKLETEKNAVRWSIICDRLKKYYTKNEIFCELVDLNLRIYKKNSTTTSAVHVIEAFILDERFQEALDFVNSIDQVEKNHTIQIEKACIYLAAGKKNQARTVARNISANMLDTPDDLLRLARIQAASQLHATSVKTLVRCFEQTPPNLLARVKKEAAALPEFTPLLTSSEFGAAMAIRSKIDPNDPACARKWIGMTIDERPWYIRGLSKREIDFGEWKVK